jgi:hypothetical protein
MQEDRNAAESGKPWWEFWQYRSSEFRMNQQILETDSEEVARLGEPRLICRTSRKTLFWGFVLASLACAFGVAVLILLFSTLLADWSKYIFGSVLFLVVGVLALWGGIVLWRKTNRLRRVEAVVHVGGLSYQNDCGCLTCRWDQIEYVWWKVGNHYVESRVVVGGFVPIAGSGTRHHTHTTHEVTVRRKDGVQMIFTDQLQDIVELARAIQQHTTICNP